MNTLCEEVLSATRGMHTKAASSYVMQKYVNGAFTLSDHANVLYQQLQIFSSLEDKLVQHPFNVPVNDLLSSLARKEKIQSDMIFFCGKLGIQQQTFSIYPETKAYVNYLEKIANDPEKLLAHAYVLYRGLMNSGFIIGNIIKTVLLDKKLVTVDIGDTDGVNYYHFKEPSFKLDQQFKDKVNDASANINQQHFIEEVSKAYQFTTAIYNVGTKTAKQESIARSCYSFWSAHKKVAITAAVAASAVLVASVAMRG